MITIGRKYHGPLRNYATECDYCGIMWHRHELKLDANGYLSCPDDRGGRVERELDEQAASEAANTAMVRGKTRG